MSLLKKEQEEQFNNLYSHYVKLMLWEAERILGNREDAEDVVQLAFVKILKFFSKIDKEIGPRTAKLFMVITRNTAIDIKRRRKETVELPDNILSGKNEIDAFIDKEAFYQDISKLRYELRDVIYLRYIEGYDVKTISKILSVSLITVYKRLNQAKKELKKIMEEVDI
ncbi:MAG: RNA polymerase sigma factor [Lachnospiraceae bacterium]|nr:RNA polymerase sigma factor [Lachnospiraceae bacterium]